METLELWETENYLNENGYFKQSATFFLISKEKLE